MTSTATREATGARYIVISADTHAVVPKEVFRPYVEARDLSAFDEELRLAEEERARARAGYSVMYAHRPEPTDELRYQAWNRAAEQAEADRVWEPQNWLGAHEAEGVVATVVFPAGSASRPPWEGFVLPVEDERLREAGKQVYNRWLADFCAAAPGRLAGVVLPPRLDDVSGVVECIQWAAQRGLRGGIWISPTLPPDLPGLHDQMYDPIWAACQDHNLPVNFHVDFGGGRPEPSTLYGDGPFAWPIAFHDAPPPYRALWFLILGGVLERFPSLTVVFTEQLASWIPYEIQRLEDVFHSKTFTSANRLRPVRETLTLTPREYWERNCRVGASFMSRGEVAMRHEIGLENIMWGSDYPHPEGTTPVTLESLRFVFASVPQHEVRQMVAVNAARVYGFDLALLEQHANRVGPTEAQIAQPLDDPPSEYEDKLVFGRGRF